MKAKCLLSHEDPAGVRWEAGKTYSLPIAEYERKQRYFQSLEKPAAPGIKPKSTRKKGGKQK